MAATAHDSRARIDSGANWFYWVAGLTAINSLVAQSDGSFTFVIGLGLTQIFDAFAAELGAVPLVLSIDALLIGACALVGYYARESRGLYLVGMGLYLMDASLFLVFWDPVAFGFHGFALYCMYNGFQGFSMLSAPATCEGETSTHAPSPV